MANLPAGRELDRAVAEAMGHRVTFHKGGAKFPAEWRVGDGDWLKSKPLDQYSTAYGPWTQEMEEWLYQKDPAGYRQDLADAILDGGELPEALARLVVKVKEAQNEST